MNIREATAQDFEDIWPIFHEIVGRLPKAFLHSSEGLVDAVIMYKWLAVL